MYFRNLHSGLQIGDLNHAEILVLIVQLMVNMTSANALAHLVVRCVTEKEIFERMKDEEHLKSFFINEVILFTVRVQQKTTESI